MLKRVLVVGGEELFWSAQRTPAPDDTQILRAEPGAPAPPGTAAVLAPVEQVAAALETALTVASWNEQVLHLLAEAIDCRESFLLGSSRRVQEHASRFARALRLSADEQLTLERGALIRDIGKIRIPNAVLLKEGVLTYEEWMMIQLHSKLGAELVEQIDGLSDTAGVVRYHHECYDGDGYPEGLERDEIPLLARIMKIVDVYCAMTSPRHYREGHSSHEEALQQIVADSGKHYDPELVRVFAEFGVGRPFEKPAATQ